MAKTAYHSFVYHSGPELEELSLLATDGQTWQAGDPYIIASGLVSPAASSAVNVKGIFAANQATSTSTSTVKVYRIKSAETKFLAYLSNGNADVAAVQATHRGVDYGLHVSSIAATVDVADESTVAVIVDEVYFNLETSKATSADSPALVLCHFKQSILDA